ncbi:MAG: hypothetical protein ABR608_14995 [Pseudonocardiaceae bacterium]
MTSSLLTATTSTAGLDSSRLIALAVLAFLGWRLALIALFPYGPHRSCKGSGKRWNGKHWRQCRGCKGTGRRLTMSTWFGPTRAI